MVKFTDAELQIWRANCKVVREFSTVQRVGAINFCVVRGSTVYYEVGVHFNCFVCGCSVVPAPFVEESIHSPLNAFDTLVENYLLRDV